MTSNYPSIYTHAFPWALNGKACSSQSIGLTYSLYWAQQWGRYLSRLWMLLALVRQTPLPKWKPLIPLFEAVMKSFQAIRDAKRANKDGFIKITIERDSNLLEEDFAPIRSFYGHGQRHRPK